MVLAIQQKFTPEELVMGGGDNFFVSEGWHETMITSLEMADAFTQGKPQDLLIHGVITSGQYAHVEPIIRLGINDDTPLPSGKSTWSKIGHSALNKIALACGLPSIPYADLEQLRNKKIMVKYVTQKGKEKKDASGFGTGEYWDDTSAARDYKAVPAVATAVTPAQVAAQPAPAQPTAPLPAAVASDSIPF
jgi:hypothetical protein